MESSKRIEQLERRVRALTVAFVLTLACFTIATLRAQSATTDNLRVRQITVVDAQGTERILIGAPLPDPIVQGERRKRSGPISGMALLDPKGNERAGFATSDFALSEVFIGLDSEKGQEARLLVNPGGGGHLTFFDADQNYARIGIWPGRPTLVLRDKGRTILEQPPAQ
jgi:hypothetical protein